MQRLLAWLCVALLVGWGGPADAGALRYPISTDPSTPIEPGSDPCLKFETDVVTLDLYPPLDKETVPMQVPKMCLVNLWDRVDGLTHTAQLFPVGIGDFLPVTASEAARRNNGGIWNRMRFVFRDFPPLRADAVGVVRVQPRDRELTFGDLSTSPSEVERRRVEFNRLDELKEVFLGGPIVNFETFIHYSPIGYARNPVCQQFFEHAGVTATVSFRRTELPNRKGHRERVLRFLACAMGSRTN